MTKAAERNRNEILIDMPIEQRQKWTRLIVNRMMMVWQVNEHKALATKLGLHSNTPSNWIQRGSVPWTAVYICHKETAISLDWLFDGVKPLAIVSNEATETFIENITVLINTCEKMGLLNVSSPAVLDGLIKGVRSCFLEALKPKNHPSS